MSRLVKLVVLTCCVVMMIACGKDESSEGIQIHPDTPDVVHDASEGDTGGEVLQDAALLPDVSDASAVPDVSPVPDVSISEDVALVDDVSSDATEDATEDAAEPTADVEEFIDPYAGRPLGQCTVNADCPEGPQGRLCNRPLPGGSCGGCSSTQGCPSDTECSNFGVCVMECQSIDDCAPGLRCLGSGQCAAQPCVQGQCPVSLFGCSDSGFCTRISCTEQSECPEQTTCTSGLCIEDRALRTGR